MDISDSSTVVEAKKLYTAQLVELLVPHIYTGFKSIFDSCVDCEYVLKTFQEKMCSVIRWNQDIIDREFERITSKVDESYISNLIDAVFVSNVKVLSSVRMGKSKKIDIKVPESKIFLHKSYIECARQIYQDPYLFDNRELYLTPAEIQRNVKRSKNIISLSIEKTIRDLIPVREIIENYLVNIGLDDLEELDEISSTKQWKGSDQEELSDRDDDFENENDKKQASESDSSSDEDPFMEEPKDDTESYVKGEEPDISSYNLGKEIEIPEEHKENSSLQQDFLEDVKPDLEVTTGKYSHETPTGFHGMDKPKEEHNSVNATTHHDEYDFFSDSD
jgi:hypothetical protein